MLKMSILLLLFHNACSYNRYKQKHDEELFMSKIQVESSCSSASTHRLTQPSTTLNRRYVRRPANIAVEEAARAASTRTSTPVPQATPSRLVNLRVHAADLEAARERELAAARAAEEAKLAAEQESIAASAPVSPVTLFPSVVEFGGAPAETPTEAPIAETNTTMPAMEPATPEAVPSQVTEFSPTTIETTTSDMQTSSYAPVVSQVTEPIAPVEASMPATPTPEIDTAELAMSIAADYATASLGVSIKEYGDNYNSYAMPDPATTNTDDPSDASVDTIARAASEAIASIRVATEPSEVSEQVASLKAFAENIKANHNTPEMRELGNTIDKFVSIAMKSTKVQEETERKNAAKVTLSPKVTRAAAKVTKSSAKVMAASAKSSHGATRTRATRPVSVQTSPHTRAISARRPNSNQLSRRPSSQELKERAIEQALHSVATMDESRNKSASAKPAFRTRKKSGGKRFAIAFACAAICVGGVLYFVSNNIPDISVQVAAMQTGIQAAYPSYIPRDYKLGDIFSENGKISMIFEGPNSATFTLEEEKSSWDSSALLRNYVEPAWGEEYATTHEQGITIYIANDTADAVWVNSGVLYRITSGRTLTKKQVRSIVVSL